MSLAWRIYLRLARAFPHEFNLVYGEELAQAGEDVMHDIARRRDAGGVLWLVTDLAMRAVVEYGSELRRDIRHAVRRLIKSPGFALVGIVSMALGIAITTNAYSSKWALLTRDLPAAANARRLVMAENPVSYYYVEQYREQKDLLAGVAALENGVPFNVRMPGQMDAKPERVFGQLVSPDYFSVLGMKAQRGRLLNPELDKPGNAPLVVISDRFWRNRLASSPDAVGQILRLNGQPATIVGITPKNFDGAASFNPAELFVPIGVPSSLAPELANDVLHRRDAKDFMALICLARGVTRDSAQAALDGITRRLDQQDVSAVASGRKAKRIVLLPAGTRVPLPPALKRAVAGFFVVLMGLTMAIVCLNLGNMLLAREANRRKEVAIRLGVGASRFRLIRQMIVEGTLLSLLGGAAGFLLAYALSVVNSRWSQPAAAPLMPDVGVDWRAAIFALVLAFLCGIGFSLGPALRATKTDIAPALKESSALELAGHRRLGVRNLLMGVQVAGSLMLLLITGFLVMGISTEANIRTNFDPNKMVLISVDPVRDGYAPEKAQALFEKLSRRLTTSGAAAGIALAAQPPFSNDDDDADARWTAEDSQVQKTAAKETVGAGYFAALNERLLAGREFEARDQQIPGDGSKAVALPVILSESAARAFFGNGNAIGKRIRDDRQSYEVAGVVRDLKEKSWISQSIVYLPLTQHDFAQPPAGGITIVARSNAKTDALTDIRGVIASIDPNLSLLEVQTLNQYFERSRSYTRSAVRTYGGIGLFGLVLSAIGLAGVTAYAVAQRRREIGIRMALGARRGQVLRLVLREGAALITAGTVIGFLGAFAMSRILSAVTKEFAGAFETGTSDPRLLAGAPLLLAALAMLACYIPARKATRIDPVTALRGQ